MQALWEVIPPCSFNVSSLAEPGEHIHQASGQKVLFDERVKFCHLIYHHTHPYHRNHRDE